MTADVGCRGRIHRQPVQGRIAWFAMPQRSAAEIEGLIDKALRNCRSPFAEGLWRRMRYLMETESDRKPHARLNGMPVLTPDQLVHATGCSGVWVSRGLPKLVAQGLIEENSEGYRSRHLQAMIDLRLGYIARQKRCKVNASAEGVKSRPRGRDISENHTKFTPAVSPPDVSPPITPSSLPPLPEDSVPTERGVAAAPAAGGAKVRKLSDAQRDTRKKFQDWWINEGWPSAHEGLSYEDFNGADAAADLKILKSKYVNWDIEKAKKVCLLYLAEPELYGSRGHKLMELGHRLGFYVTRLVRSEKGIPHGNGHSKSIRDSRTIPERLKL